MSSILWLWLASVSAAAGILLLTGVRPFDRWRKVVGEMSAGLLLASLPFAFFSEVGPVWVGLVLLGQLTLLLLAFRLIVGRLPLPFLQHSTWRNSAALLAYIWAIILIWLLAGSFIYYGVVGLLVPVLIFNLYLFAQSLNGYRRYRVENVASQKELPTVSLCIPARNEDHALADCLDAAIGSDYPKLEILVLDDCSQDKTSQLIRSFAHDGVQFIQGDVPAEGWLGKNQACDVLAAQANGEIIIFMGVDTRLSPQSISRLVAYSQHYRLDMLSVLAQRLDGLRDSTLLTQLRYYWQIMLPMTKKRVPVSSQLWLIKRKVLHQLGGFAAVRHKIVPEGSFARRLHATDSYRFVISDSNLGISTAKKWSSQLETALRLLYPTYKRQPYVTLAASLYLLAQLSAPAIVILSLVQHRYDALLAVAVCVCLIWWLSYAYYIHRVLPRYWQLHVLLAGILWPLLVLQEFILGIVSMLAYEFSDVNWKGRNVCYPVIHPPQQ